MVRAARVLQDAWASRGPLACLLAPLALVYFMLTALRRAAYHFGLLDQIRVAVPVIVVGNLVVGGTGKTPLVIALVEALRAQGYRPGVISRGHGASASARGAVHTDAAQECDARIFGDEASLIRRRTGAPLAIGRDRPLAATRLLQAYPDTDVIVSDDGLQHYRLARNVELAVFDARGAGNGWLLPAGPLREPLDRLSQVDAVVFNAQQPSLGAPHPRGFRMVVAGPEAHAQHDPTQRRLLAEFAGPGLLAVAGIGQPSRFFDMLAAAGLDFERLALPDHFDYADFDFGAHPARIILMTEKDAVKCAYMNDARIWVVPVTAQLEPGLVDLIVEKLDGLAPA